MKSTYGGFIVENIAKSIIIDCIESGDPQNYFEALRDVISDLEDSYLDPAYDDDPLRWFQEQSVKYNVGGE